VDLATDAARDPESDAGETEGAHDRANCMQG
jgi:hypothetical protein